MPRSETFGRLLKAGIGSIANCAGKTLPVIEEELGQQIGVSAATIERYRSGYIPPESKTIEILAEACVKRGLMGREWLQKLLHAARYPLVDQLLDQLCPIGTRPLRPARIYQNLPAPTYSQFVMREQAFAEVRDGLRQRSAVVLVVGLGGNGKTSLVREVTDYCLKENIEGPVVNAAVWVSDKDQPGTTSLSTLLDQIARVLDYPGLAQLPHAEKQYEVEQLLRRQAVLVVVDNFETITDSALPAWLLRLPEPSKAVVTSRAYSRAFRNNTTLVELRGMQAAEAHTFINQRLRVLRIEHLVTDQTQLETLVEATGGNPKALEMALGLIKYEQRPIQAVLDDLYRARGELFDDLFSRFWQLLGEPASHVLLAMPCFADSASAEALAATAGVTGFAFDSAVEQLTNLALIDVQQADLSSTPRYTLHPLVRAFAQARRQDMPAFEVAVQVRWGRYFVDFIARHLRTGVFEEPYWDTLLRRTMWKTMRLDLSNLLKALSWADQIDNDEMLTDLMLHLSHFLGHVSMFNERANYAQRAADAAHRLGRYVDEAFLRIDALGWIFAEMNRPTDAEVELKHGMQIVEQHISEPTMANELMILAYAFLSRASLHQGNIEQALSWLDKAMSGHCSNVIRRRVLEAAGELAYWQHDFQKAINLYLQARTTAEEYGAAIDVGERVFFQLGLAYLAVGNLAQAEATFGEILANGQQATPTEKAYAKFGLAKIAQVRGQLEAAYRLAQEVLDALNRFNLRDEHRLYKDVENFLATLHDPPAAAPDPDAA